MKKGGVKETEKNKESFNTSYYLYFLLFCLLLTTSLVIAPKIQANQTIPNDPLYSEQWNLHNYSETHGTNWEAAYKLLNQVEKEPEQKTVVIVVFDSGLNINHPDIKHAVWTNPGEVADGTDTDGNGYVDDIHGCAFTQADTSCLDANQDTNPTQHGTGVTSVIAGNIDNSEGITGMSYGFDIKVVTVKVNSNGIVNFSDIKEGLDYVQALIDSGVKIDGINMSFAAWPLSQDSTKVIDEQIESLTQQGVIFVAGSGNSANSNTTNLVQPKVVFNSQTDINYSEEGVAWPANNPNVVAVGGHGRDGKRAESASFGSELDITAPSVGVKTACYQQDYCTLSGTSLSGPEVMAAAALIKAYTPEATIHEVRELVRQTAGQQFTLEYGYGPLNFQAIANTLLLENKIYLPVLVK